jgi:hypothetical protein
MTGNTNAPHNRKRSGSSAAEIYAARGSKRNGAEELGRKIAKVIAEHGSLR